MRLDRFIAENSPYSRTEVKRLIKQKTVLIDGRVASNAAEKIQDQTISVEGKRISEVGLIYLMLNKPTGYVSSTLDAEHATVIELLQAREYFLGDDAEWERLQLTELQICGRLDLDTTGLLLLSNDGQWNHQITSPNTHCTKTYHVELAETLKEADIEAFNAGIQLKNEDKACKPAKLEIINEHNAVVSIQEGKYHQVKRMFAACDNKVVGLHRSRIGTIELGGNLATGQFRFLTPEEFASLRA